MRPAMCWLYVFMRTTDPGHLFVYGTLREDCHHPMSRVLQRHARRIGPGIFQGCLYRIGWYPGAQDSLNPGERVEGELYRLERPGPCLEALDAYEGDEFQRVVRSIQSGRRLFSAWIYLYTPSTAGLPRIRDGRFVTR